MNQKMQQLWLVRCHNTGTKYYAGISTTAITQQHNNNNNNDRLTAFDPGQPG